MGIIILIAAVLAIIIAIAAIKLLFMVLKGLYRLIWWFATQRPRQPRQGRRRRLGDKWHSEPVAEVEPQRQSLQPDTPESMADPKHLRRPTPRPEKLNPWQLYTSGLMPENISVGPPAVPEINSAPPEQNAEPPSTAPKTLALAGDFPEPRPGLDMNPFDRFWFWYFFHTPYMFIGKN